MRLIVGTLFTFFLCLGVTSTGEARDDWEYWGSYSLKTALAKKVDLKIGHEHKFRDDLGNFYLANGVVTLLWKPSKHFEIGPHYKFEYEKSNTTGKNTDENRLGGEASLKASIRKWKFSNRHRVVWRNVSGNQFWRWRTRLKVAHPLTLGDIQMTPFVSEEIFWDTRQEEFNQNRVTLGVSKKLTKRASVSLWYMLRSDRKGGDWDERNVIGTEVSTSF